MNELLENRSLGESISITIHQLAITHLKRKWESEKNEINVQLLIGNYFGS